MTHLLKFESDCRTIQIISNSLNFNLSDAHRREEKRGKYMAKIGYLYPERYDTLMNVANAGDLRKALDGSDYFRVLEHVPMEEGQQAAVNEAEDPNETLDYVMLKE